MDGNTVVLNLGGRERRLRYDLNGIAEIGERLGIMIKLESLGSDLLGRELPLKSLRTILWAGLIHEDPELTEQQVGAWVDQDNLAEVLTAFFGLFGGTGAMMQQRAAPLPPDQPKPRRRRAKTNR